MTAFARRALTGVVYGVLVLGAVFASREVFVAALVVIAGLALFELATLRRSGVPALLELIIVCLGIVSLVFLRDVNAFPFRPLLMTIFAVWAADVVAYIVGSWLGRRKIVPRLSPGKTWEGTLAGFAAAALVVIAANAPVVGLHPWWIVTAVLIGPAAFGGDLLESWVKRRAGVKDSGRVLPGHGGVLDRIDSLVAAAPIVAVAIVLL